LINSRSTTSSRSSRVGVTNLLVSVGADLVLTNYGGITFLDAGFDSRQSEYVYAQLEAGANLV
jgi:hypothetical protein